MSGLTINALCAGYGKRRIIEHLSISTLPRGEVTVLLGPNGCGKSTLTIAVDPKVIPLGSKVYIPGYGYAIASDTGGAIKGDKIDLYMNSESACLNFGRQTVKLYVVAYPGQW